MVDHRGIWTVWTAKFIFNAILLLLLLLLLLESHLINRAIRSTLLIKYTANYSVH